MKRITIEKNYENILEAHTHHIFILYIYIKQRNPYFNEQIC